MELFIFMVNFKNNKYKNSKNKKKIWELLILIKNIYRTFKH
jgi:hypothetical protein